MLNECGFGKRRLAGLFAAGTVAATLGLAGTAQASNVNDLLFFDANYPDGQWNTASDGNRQWMHENRSGSTPPVIDVGDTIRGMFRFTEIRTSPGGDEFSRNDHYGELFGVFNLIVTDVDPVTGVTSFGADPNFWSAGEPGDGFPGAVMVLWESPTGISDFWDGAGTYATAQEILDARIAQGDRYLTAGFTGQTTDVEYGPDPGDVVTDVILPDPAAVERWTSTPDPAQGTVDSDFGMSLLQNAAIAELFDSIAGFLAPRRGTGAEFEGNSDEIFWTGNVPGADTRFDFTGDDTNVRMHLVPLPAAAWGGLGLLGVLGGCRVLRRRKA